MADNSKTGKPGEKSFKNVPWHLPAFELFLKLYVASAAEARALATRLGARRMVQQLDFDDKPLGPRVDANKDKIEAQMQTRIEEAHRNMQTRFGIKDQRAGRADSGINVFRTGQNPQGAIKHVSLMPFLDDLDAAGFQVIRAFHKERPQYYKAGDPDVVAGKARIGEIKENQNEKRQHCVQIDFYRGEGETPWPEAAIIAKNLPQYIAEKGLAVAVTVWNNNNFGQPATINVSAAGWHKFQPLNTYAELHLDQQARYGYSFQLVPDPKKKRLLEGNPPAVTVEGLLEGKE
ncbi:hypothetical protein EXS71_02040 [Candidatus Uhrbacteria bacterium]|nr:hypothetical protein [Candidatus Uhrbacteria bacterium]